ncbi:MAG: hypothetical protein ACRD3W_18590 [Terriglobales bacterium]
MLENDVLTALPTGMAVGMKKMSADGLSELTLVRNTSGGAIAAHKASKFFGASFQVGPVAAVGDITFGSNDKPAASIPDQSYFWLSTRFYINPLLAAGVALGTTVSSNATSGTLGANGAVDNDQTNIVAMAASGGGGSTLCFLH